MKVWREQRDNKEGDGLNPCCPQGTTNVHSMCLNCDEMQKKDEIDSRILNCAGGVAKGFITGNPGGGLSNCAG